MLPMEPSHPAKGPTYRCRIACPCGLSMCAVQVDYLMMETHISVFLLGDDCCMRRAVAKSVRNPSVLRESIGNEDERMMIYSLIGAFALIIYEHWNDWQPDADNIQALHCFCETRLCSPFGAAEIPV